MYVNIENITGCLCAVNGKMSSVDDLMIDKTCLLVTARAVGRAAPISFVSK